MPAEDAEADKLSGLGGQASRSLIGRVIGDFEIRREIGRGGMGVVYEAWQHSLQRVVAVKVLSTPIGLSPTAVQRFQREAQAAAKLHHANIVRIYAQGEADGIYYYAMELIEGRSVYEIIEEARRQLRSSDLSATETRVINSPKDGLSDSDSGSGTAGTGQHPSSELDSGMAVGPVLGSPSPTAIEDSDTIARLMATVAEALEYAHKSGVIHRDVKPHNLILGDDGRLCISDFGLARVLEQPGVTVTGEFLGSPLYMSPEQVSGGAARVDQRTDIYSLGVTLYEWMTLRPPFPGQSRDQVVTQILTAEPVPPREFNPNIPVDLDTICMKAIERDTNHRYQTAGQMATDLRAYLERSEIKARRAGPFRRLSKLVYRRRVGVLLGALAVVIAVSAGLMYYQRARLTQPGRPGQTTGAEAPDAAVGVTPAGTGLTKPIAALPGTAPTAVAEQQPDTAADGSWAAALNQGTETTQRLLEGLRTGQTTSDAGLSAELDAFERYVAQSLANVLAAQHSLAVLAVLLEPTEPGSADDFYFKAVFVTDDQTALSLLESALEREPDHYSSLHMHAVVLCRLYRFAEMAADARHLVRIAPDLVQSHLVLGTSLLLIGDARQALDELDLAQAIGGETAWLHALRGLCLARENLGQALGPYTQALALDPNHVVARFARGRAQLYLGVFDAALLDAEKVVELLPDSAEAFAFRGECHDKLGHYRLAIEDYDRAIEFGGNATKLYFKQTMAALNEQALEDQRRAAEAEPADHTPGESQPGPAARARPTKELNPLDRFLRELAGSGQAAPPPDPEADEPTVP